MYRIGLNLLCGTFVLFLVLMLGSLNGVLGFGPCNATLAGFIFLGVTLLCGCAGCVFVIAGLIKSGVRRFRDRQA